MPPESGSDKKQPAPESRNGLLSVMRVSYSETYGIRAMVLARLMAVESWR